MLKVLFVSSEVHPLIKTGGLADVCGSLPPALQALGCDVRILLPGYQGALARAGRLKTVAHLDIPGLRAPVSVLEGTLPGTRVKTWLLDHPPAYARPGNPYLHPDGHPWFDNAQRFALLARAAVNLARGKGYLGWHADVVHCHDWQTGLVPVLLALEARRPAVVFTIHNLAYQGLFPYATFQQLGLAESLWHHEALEFHGQLSFMKGGLVFADKLNTVSPTYAQEIQTSVHGCGLDGLLRHRADDLSGILNGIDTKVWNPARDPHLVQPYHARRLTDKRANKLAVQHECGLPADADVPLITLVGRLVHQKGIDLVLDALPKLRALKLQIAILGGGDSKYEHALREQAARFPEQLAVRIGFDEAAAHRMEAGGDMFLMPSRFEPCGLNQMYSLRYGTPPIVHRVGGLADTVVDATPENLKAGTATGFVFEAMSGDALITAVQRALRLYGDARAWKKLELTGMRQDFSWRTRGEQYMTLYREARRDARLS
jgi:starch synthase